MTLKINQEDIAIASTPTPNSEPSNLIKKDFPTSNSHQDPAPTKELMGNLIAIDTLSQDTQQKEEEYSIKKHVSQVSSGDLQTPRAQRTTMYQ